MKSPSEITAGIKQLVVGSEEPNIVTLLGEALGVSKSASRQAKQQMFMRFLKTLGKSLGELRKVTSILGVTEKSLMLTDHDLAILRSYRDSVAKLSQIEDQIGQVLEKLEKK